MRLVPFAAALCAALFGLGPWAVHAAGLEEQIAAKIKETTGMPASSVKPAPVPNLYEVVVGKQIFYVDRDVHYLIAGEIYDVAAKKNLTSEHLKEVTKLLWKELPFQDSIKVVYGKGERAVAVFTDANCRYCSILETSLRSVDNVTVYNFIFPILNSENISRRIVCSDKPAETWQKHMLSGYTPPPVPGSCDSSVLSRNLRLGRSLDLTATPTIIFQNGTIYSGAMSPEQLNKALTDNK